MVAAYSAWLASFVVAWLILGSTTFALIVSLFVLVPAVRWAQRGATWRPW